MTSSRPGASLPTGVPVFVGRAERGPVNEAQRFTLWSQFEATFGADGYLSYAVRGFFENDGLLCHALCLDPELSPIDALRTGLTAAAELDVDLVCAPDIAAEQDAEAVTALQQEVLEHCDRVGTAWRSSTVFRPPRRQSSSASVLSLSSTNGALYHPWLWVPGHDDEPRYVPPCGHVAGVYARCDRLVGAHQAPANEPIEGVLDVRVNHTAAEVGTSSPAGSTASRSGRDGGSACGVHAR